ncbi:MFS transporter [Rhodococcus sp. MEB064]|nr:MFS transporter [Rhodococcus sp. MEB064]
MRSRVGLSPAAALTLIAASTFLSMSVWFSASFVLPQLTSEWHLSTTGASLLTIAVQAGFVIGALTSAATGLSDAVPAKYLIAIGAVGAAASNVALLGVDSAAGAFPLRLSTGVFLACVYPPALKEISTWFRRGRGKALGIMIGALTLGSALPHLVNSVGDLAWQTVIITTSVMTMVGAFIILLVRSSGPYPFPRRQFDAAGAIRSLKNRDVVLANIGYMGHMWELYAMWAFIGTFLATATSLSTRPDADSVASAWAFVCIGAGALGCLAGGVLSDRFGRAQSALLCLVCSGVAAVAVGLSGALPLPAVLGLCAFWGFWVIADSAQFSALVTERADPVYVGGAVSVQLALGYFTTTVTLWTVPIVVRHISWSAALLVLALGPLLGSAAMMALIRRDRGRVRAHMVDGHSRIT